MSLTIIQIESVKCERINYSLSPKQKQIPKMAARKKIQDAVTDDDDLKYETWAPIMKATLTEVGLWDVVENGVPPDPSKIPELAATIQAPELSKWRNLAIKDMKALKIMQSSLPDFTFRRTLPASSAKELWDLLKKGNDEAKLRRLERDFEEIRMNEGETIDSYLDRVMDIVEQLEKSDYEVITKVLGSLSVSYECVASLMKKRINLKKTSLVDFLEFLYRFGSLPGRTVGLMMKDQFDSQSKPRKGVVAEYELLALTVGDFRYDEDMWMIYTGATNHMTPYLKFFTALDRTHRARVKLADGSFIMAEGRGDVKIMTEEGGEEKTVKNVVFVPEINRNVLSVPQFTSIGYSAIMEGNNGVLKFTIKDPSRKLFGEAMLEERGFFLRFQVIEGDLTTP